MNRAYLENITPNLSSSIYYTHQKEEEALPDNYWHFHDMYELVFIPFGTGKRFINNHVSHYENGDLVLLPPYIPHNTLYKEYQGARKFEQYVILFDIRSFQKIAAGFKEFETIHRFLYTIDSAIVFDTSTKQTIGSLMEQMKSVTHFERIIFFFKIMHILSASTHIPLAGEYKTTSSKNAPILHQIKNYIAVHYKKNLSSSAMALKIGMTPSSFCRYIKKTTGKTYKELILEARLQHACYLLKESSMTIENIATESGFVSIPLFYKKFKSLLQLTPAQYRNEI